jgi:epoxide hydrolase 4
MPILPERELSNENLFIHETFKDLIDDINENGCVEGFKRSNLIETYEYIFHQSGDWTGALNYYRNLLFYRVNPSSMLK